MDPNETPYKLYRVAVFNPNDGKILVEPFVVSALSNQAAHNKAVAKLATAVTENGSTLDQLLDTAEVVVRTF